MGRSPSVSIPCTESGEGPNGSFAISFVQSIDPSRNRENEVVQNLLCHHGMRDTIFQSESCAYVSQQLTLPKCTYSALSRPVYQFQRLIERVAERPRTHRVVRVAVLLYRARGAGLKGRRRLASKDQLVEIERRAEQAPARYGCSGWSRRYMDLHHGREMPVSRVSLDFSARLIVTGIGGNKSVHMKPQC